MANTPRRTSTNPSQDALASYQDNKLRAEKNTIEELANYEYNIKLNFDKELIKLRKKAEKETNAALKKQYETEYKNREKLYNAQVKMQKKLDEKARKEQAHAEATELLKHRKDLTKEELKAAKDLYKATATTWSDNFDPQALADKIADSIGTFLKNLDNSIDTIAEYQGRWNTRLLGSGKTFQGTKGLAKTVTGLTALSPFVQQQKVMQNMDSLVNKGIAFNVEQRAFLQTIAEKVATTFDAANGTLLNLIRIQQADTTAARLGLESDLTKYLNRMYQNTEYLSDVFDSVSSNIYEATASMGARLGVEVEYEIQKWLGSLYSVGMSSSAISSISSAIGMLGSGNISGLAGNTALQNLLVLSATKAGLSYVDLLNNLDAGKTNALLEAMVSYLASIDATNTKVVKSQYGQIFGMSLSDIKAAANLAKDLGITSRKNLSYGSAISNLFSETSFAKMIGRTSIGEMIQNVWENTQYTMASSIASSPALYALWKVTNLVDAVAQGLKIPDVSVVGNAVNLRTDIATLMRAGVLGQSLLGSIGSIIAGGNLSAAGGWSVAGALKALGVNAGLSQVTRSRGIDFEASGLQTSRSEYIGNTAGSDVYSATAASAEDQREQARISAKEEQKETIAEVEKTTFEYYMNTVIDVLTELRTGNISVKTMSSNFGG